MKCSRSAGFTLVEILVVVLIIGLLSSVVSIGVVKHLKKAQINAARAQIKTLRLAVVSYEMEVLKFPISLQDLVFEGDENWPGPFLDSEEVPLDPWGNDYQLAQKGKRFRITSAGPDGQLDTEDDLWK